VPSSAMDAAKRSFAEMPPVASAPDRRPASERADSGSSSSRRLEGSRASASTPGTSMRKTTRLGLRRSASLRHISSPPITRKPPGDRPTSPCVTGVAPADRSSRTTREAQSQKAGESGSTECMRKGLRPAADSSRRITRDSSCMASRVALAPSASPDGRAELSPRDMATGWPKDPPPWTSTIPRADARRREMDLTASRSTDIGSDFLVIREPPTLTIS